nr:unnamed protein product [Callosobruchus analis]
MAPSQIPPWTPILRGLPRNQLLHSLRLHLLRLPMEQEAAPALETSRSTCGKAQKRPQLRRLQRRAGRACFRGFSRSQDRPKSKEPPFWELPCPAPPGSRHRYQEAVILPFWL